MRAFDPFFDLADFRWRTIFSGITHPWDVLQKGKIAESIAKLNKPEDWRLPITGFRKTAAAFFQGKIYESGLELKNDQAAKGKLAVYINGERADGASWIAAGCSLVGNDIDLGPGSLIEQGATVKSPILFGKNCEIRQGAYLRGEIVCGDGAVIGHASEVKSSIFLNRSKAPHFAYVGDSILGNDVNLGAGTKVSNLKITGDEIVVRYQGKTINSGLRKFGAILGDRVESGCNSVLNPGTLIEKDCLIYPCTAPKKDHYLAGSILRADGSIGKRRLNQ